MVETLPGGDLLGSCLISLHSSSSCNMMYEKTFKKYDEHQLRPRFSVGSVYFLLLFFPLVQQEKLFICFTFADDICPIKGFNFFNFLFFSHCHTERVFFRRQRWRPRFSSNFSITNRELLAVCDPSQGP